MNTCCSPKPSDKSFHFILQLIKYTVFSYTIFTQFCFATAIYIKIRSHLRQFTLSCLSRNYLFVFTLWFAFLFYFQFTKLIKSCILNKYYRNIYIFCSKRTCLLLQFFIDDKTRVCGNHESML